MTDETETALTENEVNEDPYQAGFDCYDFLYEVLIRTEEIVDGIQANENDRGILNEHFSTHLNLLDTTVKWLGQLMCIVDDQDKRLLEDLQSVFLKLYEKLWSYQLRSQSTHLSAFPILIEQTGRPGRPPYVIAREFLEELRGLGFAWTKIAAMFKVSRWTIMRRVRDYGLQDLAKFSDISDQQVDEVITNYISGHGSTTGEVYLRGHFRALGYNIQRQRIRESLNRVDPRNTALRWGALVSRRKYFVPWPNSLWHMDGHHSLIRWGFVIHGCVDGYSRRINFLHCSTNNLATTVLSLFEDAIQRDGGLWPSRIRVDHGVENVAVCDAMVAMRGEGRGSFIAGSSCRNQRIERLWRDVFRCVSHIFYYTFYAMEQTGLLDLENPIHMFVLHWVFLGRINYALHEWMDSFNNHPLSTEHNWSPNQLWINGMLRQDNPLATGEVDDDPDDTRFYGEDLDGPTPFEDSDNNWVIVSPVNVPGINTEELVFQLTQSIDPLKLSPWFGIDIFTEALTFVVQLVENEQSR